MAFVVPEEYTDYTGASQPFFFYRFEAVVRVTATVTNATINAVKIGLFDPAAKGPRTQPSAVVQASYTFDWATVPLST
jgi:hypothetical protein